MQAFVKRHYPLLFPVCINMLVYYGAKGLLRGAVFHDVRTAWDGFIPFLPSWVLIYVAAFPFWIIAYMRIAGVSRTYTTRFCSAEIIGKLVCGTIFLLYPSMNVRPNLTVDGPLTGLLSFIWHVDAPTILCPSIHCYLSWVCFIWTFRVRDRLGRGYTIFTFVMAVLICLSTLFTKQHALPDVISGVVLAQCTLLLGMKTSIHRPFAALIQRLDGCLFKNTGA
ncbi:MAG: phosphatidic acid phosphatase [Eubacteriales bacterium]|nr:phosphatidic acid phosphatase [Eubacteriales bacterium]